MDRKNGQSAYTVDVNDGTIPVDQTAEEKSNKEGTRELNLAGTMLTQDTIPASLGKSEAVPIVPTDGHYAGNVGTPIQVLTDGDGFSYGKTDYNAKG